MAFTENKTLKNKELRNYVNNFNLEEIKNLVNTSGFIYFCLDYFNVYYFLQTVIGIIFVIL